MQRPVNYAKDMPMSKKNPTTYAMVMAWMVQEPCYLFKYLDIRGGPLNDIYMATNFYQIMSNKI